MIVDRIRARCPELTSADTLLVARMLADRRRAEDGLAPSRKPNQEAARQRPPLRPVGPPERGSWGNVARTRPALTPRGLALLGVVRALDARGKA